MRQRGEHEDGFTGTILADKEDYVINGCAVARIAAMDATPWTPDPCTERRNRHAPAAPGRCASGPPTIARQRLWCSGIRARPQAGSPRSRRQPPHCHERPSGGRDDRSGILTYTFPFRPRILQTHRIPCALRQVTEMPPAADVPLPAPLALVCHRLFDARLPAAPAGPLVRAIRRHCAAT